MEVKADGPHHVFTSSRFI